MTRRQPAAGASSCDASGVPEIELAQGTVRYRDEGSGPPIVFVHGALVDGRLWEPVVERLRGSARCIVPDLPLGAHRIAMRPDADVSPTGLAALIADLLAALDLKDVTLVGNDTGGGLCQLLVTRRPERIARLVLTNCDAFDNFPPAMFRGLVVAARLRLLTALLQTMRVRALRRTPLAFGWLTKRQLPGELLESWVEPFLRDAGVRRDTRRLLAAVRPAELLDNAARLSEFDRPVLIAWAPEDRFFPIDHGRRLAAIFPDARLVEVPDSYAFVSLDQPKRVADLIREFAA
jgi:pimeloyl-ACP methyl ester carboxylesterase